MPRFAKRVHGSKAKKRRCHCKDIKQGRCKKVGESIGKRVFLDAPKEFKELERTNCGARVKTSSTGGVKKIAKTIANLVS